MKRRCLEIKDLDWKSVISTHIHLHSQFQKLRRWWFEHRSAGLQGRGDAHSLGALSSPLENWDPLPVTRSPHQEAVCSIRLVLPLSAHRDSARDRRVGSSLEQLPVDKPQSPPREPTQGG